MLNSLKTINCQPVADINHPLTNPKKPRIKANVSIAKLFSKTK